MDGTIVFNGRFQAASRQNLRPGGWYIGFLCRGCGKHFAIMDEPSDSGGVALSGDAVFEVVCPDCALPQTRPAAELVAFEAAQGGPASTA